MLQRAVAMVLEPIYEQDFLDSAIVDSMAHGGAHALRIQLDHGLGHGSAEQYTGQGYDGNVLWLDDLEIAPR